MAWYCEGTCGEEENLITLGSVISLFEGLFFLHVHLIFALPLLFSSHNQAEEHY